MGGLYWLVIYFLLEQEEVETPLRLRKTIFQSVKQVARKKNPSAPNKSQIHDLPVTSSDALPLSYRRIVGAEPGGGGGGDFFDITVRTKLDYFKKHRYPVGAEAEPFHFHRAVCVPD